MIEAISQIVQDERCAGFMKSKIDSKVDVSDMDAEIEAYGKQLRQCNSRRDIILSDIDSLDVDDKHYKRRKTDLENSLYRLYDKIEEIEDLIMDARAKRKTAISEKMSTDNIYKTIVYVDRFWDKMEPQERRDFIEQIVSEVNVYEDRTPEGQWLKSIKFNLPLVAEDMTIGLDKGDHVEVVTLLQLSNRKPDAKIRIDIDLEDYYRIKDRK